MCVCSSVLISKELRPAETPALKSGRVKSGLPAFEFKLSPLNPAAFAFEHPFFLFIK
jgi:hypothetical protein